MDACLSDNLDDISVNLRKVLNVKEDRILFPNDVKIIIDKINNNLECYEVKYGTINDLKLINNCYVIIISNDQSEDEQFYYLLNALCYSLLIDYVKHQVPGHVLKHVNSLRTGRQIDCHVL